MTLQEAVALLAAHPNRDEVVSALEAQAGQVTQAIFNKGHGVGYAKKHAEVEALSGRLAEADTALKARDATIADLRSKTPELATLQQQHTADVTALQTKHKDELAAATQRLAQVTRGIYLRDLKSALTSTHKVDPDYAQVLTEKAEVQSRVAVDAEGHASILQPGLSVPYAAATAEDGVKLLAEALAKNVEARWLTSGADRGAGAGATGHGTPSGGAPTGDAYYEAIRQRTRAELDKKKTEAAEAQKVLTSLGITTTT